MGSSPKPPAAPDYVGAAKATGESQLENTRLQAELNRPNVNTPLGSQTWTQGPAGPNVAAYNKALADWEAAKTTTGGGLGGTLARLRAQQAPAPTQDQFMNPGGYTQNVTLAPGQQEIFDNQQQMEKLMSSLGISQIEGASDMLSKPFDLDSVGGGQDEIQNALYRRSTSMLDPQFAQAEDKERDRLANQGFQVGNAGYDKAIGNFDRSKAFAYGDARDRAIVGGQDARKQAVQEALLARQTPINEINALKSGSQIQMPQFQSTAPVGNIPGTDFSGATTAAGQYGMGLYGNQVAERNAQTQALGSAATMAAMYAMMGASDRRLKRDIQKLWDDPRGFGIYKFRFKTSDVEHIGVMADEVEKVMPEAVTEVNGYKAVYYGRL